MKMMFDDFMQSGLIGVSIGVGIAVGQLVFSIVREVLRAFTK
jgi:hypothetical protein